MQNRYFTDEELVAYLDGETEFAPVDDIDACVKTDSALRDRLKSLWVLLLACLHWRSELLLVAPYYQER